MGTLLFKNVISTQRQLTPEQKQQQNRLIGIGIIFMGKQGVQHIPSIEKKIFLRKKGLSQKIIQKVFNSQSRFFKFKDRRKQPKTNRRQKIKHKKMDERKTVIQKSKKKSFLKAHSIYIGCNKQPFFQLLFIKTDKINLFVKITILVNFCQFDLQQELMFPSSKNIKMICEEDSQPSQTIKSELNIVGTYLNVYPLQKQKLLPQYFSNFLKRLSNRTKTLKQKLIQKHNLQNVTLDQYLYKCKKCGKAYEKSTSLGGHISKAHVKFNQLNQENYEVKNKILVGATRLQQNIDANGQYEKGQNSNIVRD